VREPLPSPPMEQSHLSRDAHDRLSQELEERSTSRRLEISHKIEEAREHGDIKENADYDAAKNEQGHNEARIRQIEQILRDAVIVERGNAEVVEPGVLVELRHEGDDATEIYLVGSIEERHDTYEVVSTSSPLGVALLGAAPGATVTYQGPRRELSVKVVSVRQA
jgi:transcription elongation factor GreA